MITCEKCDLSVDGTCYKWHNCFKIEPRILVTKKQVCSGDDRYAMSVDKFLWTY